MGIGNSKNVYTISHSSKFIHGQTQFISGGHYTVITLSFQQRSVYKGILFLTLNAIHPHTIPVYLMPVDTLARLTSSIQNVGKQSQVFVTIFKVKESMYAHVRLINLRWNGSSFYDCPCAGDRKSVV